MPEQPSISELVRRIEDMVRAVEKLQHTLENKYLSKEVWNLERKELERRITTQERAREEDRRWRRQVTAGIAVGVIVMVVQIVVTIAMNTGGLT